MVLPSFSWAGGLHFVADKTYQDQAAYQLEKGRPFALANADSLRFFNRKGAELKTVSLAGESHKGNDRFGKDSWGIARSALIGPDTAATVARSSGYESCGSSVTFYNRLGVELGQFRAPSCGYLVSPRADRVIAAHSDGYASLPRFTLYSSTGGAIAEISAPQNHSSSPRFAFNADGSAGAIFYGGPALHGGGIIIFSYSGDVLGRYTNETWTPLSSTIEDAAAPVRPLALVDQLHGIVVAQGIVGVPSKRSLKGISFWGGEKWSLARPNDECPAALTARLKAKSTLLLEFCGARLIVTDIETTTGKTRSTKEHRLPGGKPAYVNFSVSSDEKLLLIALVQQERGEPQRFLVLNEELDIVWERGSFDLTEAMRFAWGGAVELLQGGKVTVGRFAPD